MNKCQEEVMLEFCQLSQQEYDAFQRVHPYRNFMNTVKAMEVKLHNGWAVEYVGVKKDGQLVCATPLTSIPVMKIYRYFYAQRGFLMDYADQEVLDFFAKNLKKHCKKQKGLYLVCDPNVMYKERDIDGNLVEGGFDHSYVVDHMIKAGFEHQGFTIGYNDVSQVRWMFSLYLDGKDEKTILKQCHQQTRWSINKTLKQGIEVREMSLDEMDIFYRMMDETAKRRGFAEREHEFYRSQMEIYGDMGKLLVAYLDVQDFRQKNQLEKEQLDKEMAEVEKKLEEVANSKKFLKKKKVLMEAYQLNEKKQKEADELEEKYGSVIYMASTYFVINDNEITYLYSATDDTFRKYNAPYALQWYMIRYGLEHHIPKYNFYGISGNFDKEAVDYGVYDFKRGFNGVVEELVGEFVLPINPPMYNLYKSIKK